VRPSSTLFSAAVFSSAASLLFMTAPAHAQNDDFHLAYHVERTPSEKLSIETCGSVVAAAAQKVGLSAGSQNFPGQLVLVSGGLKGKGAFVVQCISVEDITVSVVQGIDYSQQKGALGNFADNVYEELKAAAN
jgi:hypothetical protein